MLAYDTRKKKCSYCDRANARGASVKDHDCRKNWTGSAKAMEADMLVSMIKKTESLTKERAAVKTVVCDEDGVSIARVKKEIRPDIEKASDANHIKKNLGTKLHSLQKTSCKISQITISYLQKCFNYMLAQNKGQFNFFFHIHVNNAVHCCKY